MNNNYTLFKQIIRESNYDNTYKMAWAKSLVELSTQLDFNDSSINISFDDIAKKYIKYYWNQTIFFNLKQGSNPLKPPLILTYVKDLIQLYFNNAQSNIPELFEKAETKFEMYNLMGHYNKLIEKTTKTLKRDVSWRFLFLNGKNTQIYSYIRGNTFLIIDCELLKVFKENEQDLYDLINYRWGLVLETFNSSPRINKKVKIMDERDIKRNSLNKFKNYLDLENKKHKCFICNEYINDISIDHVIPWSYMYSDDIWNLVYVCKGCNSSKNNRIPSEEQINKLKMRNLYLLNSMEENEIKDKFYDELKLSIEKDYVNKFWIGSKN
ncbi:MAG: HNH endonuclease signature motif containing protein [Malacoplasma sp.]